MSWHIPACCTGVVISGRGISSGPLSSSGLKSNSRPHGPLPPHSPAVGYHGVSAALEFALAELKVKHIVVLGHAQCGGVRAFGPGGRDSCRAANLV